MWIFSSCAFLFQSMHLINEKQSFDYFLCGSYYHLILKPLLPVGNEGLLFLSLIHFFSSLCVFLAHPHTYDGTLNAYRNSLNSNNKFRYYSFCVISFIPLHYTT